MLEVIVKRPDKTPLEARSFIIVKNTCTFEVASIGEFYELPYDILLGVHTKVVIRAPLVRDFQV